MASTRITVVLQVDHEPDMESDIELPRRAADFLEHALTQVDGLGAVDVISGETDTLVWTPRRERGYRFD